MSKRRTSTFEDIVGMVSRLPWWIGFLLAVVSFPVLHLIAGIQIDKPVGANQLGAYAGKQLYVTLANFGQYVLPAFLGIGAYSGRIRPRFRQESGHRSGRNPAGIPIRFRPPFRSNPASVI